MFASETIKSVEHSASLLALHKACNNIKNGNAQAALVAGINLVATSADNVDVREREAVVAVFIKPLSHAIRDGNPIQAVIRATSAYHDKDYQKVLNSQMDAHGAIIRQAYDSAGLNPRDTVYIEVSFYSITYGFSALDGK
ncbi:hypothetical protein ACQKWADRAFT_281452 [Trichoderma austrokoningii]